MDYSIKPISKYFLYTDIPLREGIRHINYAINGKLTLDAKIKHLALGILKCIPLIGHAFLLMSVLLCQRKFAIGGKNNSTRKKVDQLKMNTSQDSIHKKVPKTTCPEKIISKPHKKPSKLGKKPPAFTQLLSNLPTITFLAPAKKIKEKLTTQNNPLKNPLPSTDPTDSSWDPLMVPVPKNENEKKLRAAKQVIIDLENSNPYFSCSRYRIFYKGFKQYADNPWEKAYEAGDIITVEKFLSNPHFKANLSYPLQKAFEQGNAKLINTFIKAKGIEFHKQIWNKSNSESLLFALIKGGRAMEENINLLLDLDYDVNLLEIGYDQSEEYKKLSEQCRNRIETARERNKLSKLTYTKLEELIFCEYIRKEFTELELAILHGETEKVSDQLNTGACVNHARGRPLAIAVEIYMRRTPGNGPSLIPLGKHFPPKATQQELAKRREIIEIILAKPLLRVSELDADAIWKSLCKSHKPKQWEELVASILKRGVVFSNIKDFVFWMRFEQFTDNSPIVEALTEEQKLMIEQFRNNQFMRTLFEMEASENMTAEVYKMLQILWETLQTSKVMTQNFTEQTLSTLTQAIKNIPIVYKIGDHIKLFDQIKAGLPVIIPAGWNGHATSIVFYKNKIIFGNRGAASQDYQSGLHIYEYTTSLLEANDLDGICQTDISKKESFDMMFDQYAFEEGIIKKLKYRAEFNNQKSLEGLGYQDEDGCEDGCYVKKIKSLEMPAQIVGNCTWSSSAYLGFFSALYCIANEVEGKELEAVHRFVVDEFEPAVKILTIQKYIADYKKAITKAWFTHNSELFRKIIISYYDKIMTEKEDSLVAKHALEVIDLLVYSGLTTDSGNIKKTNYSETDQNRKRIDWLEKRYDLSWDERLSHYMSRHVIDFSDPFPSHWGYNQTHAPTIW